MKSLHRYIYMVLLLAFIIPAAASADDNSRRASTDRHAAVAVAATAVRDDDGMQQRLTRQRNVTFELTGRIGEYFLQKLVPFDNNGNFLLDTVSILHERIFGELDYLNDSTTAQRYIKVNPDYYRLFVPLTYYRSAIRQYSTIDNYTDPLHRPYAAMNLDTASQARMLSPMPQVKLRNRLSVERQVDDALLSVYLTRPDRVVFCEDSINALREFSEDLVAERRTAQQMTRQNVGKTIDVGPAAVIEQEAGVAVSKPNWWKVTGGGSLQLSQLFLSDNWYKGGESSNSLLATFQIAANYNDQNRVQWENLIDAKLGLASTPSDTVHDYLTNTDQLRIYSKLGIQASKYWYYTVSAEFKTQFVNGYKANNSSLISSFLAPADLTVALGMDYKRKKEGKYSFSLFLAPLNWTMRYIGDKNIDVTIYGLTAGKTVKHNLGSEVQPTIQLQLTRNISIESRLDYLTSYHWVRVEWENTVNMALNRYLSTKLYVHARYDDSAAPISGKSHFQLSELLSFGVNYQW